MDADRLQSVMARWFPHRVVTISRPATGVSTLVFHVRVDGDIYWARLGEDAGERRDGEVAAHRLMNGIGLPVPGVVRYEADPPELDRSISLTTHIPGVPIATLPPAPWLQDVAVEAGRILARINAIEIPGFGWAYASERQGTPRGHYPSRAAWAREYGESLRTVDASGVLPLPVIRAVSVAVETWAGAPDRSTSSLAHGDFDASHLYVDPERRVLTGIIDFGEVRGAGRLYDLGHLLLHDGEQGRPELFTSVLRGYAEIFPLPGDVIHRIRREAITIGTRALSIQLERPPSAYRDWLTTRLVSLTQVDRERRAS